MSKGKYKGKEVEEMTREELIEAVLNLGYLYTKQLNEKWDEMQFVSKK